MHDGGRRYQVKVAVAVEIAAGQSAADVHAPGRCAAVLAVTLSKRPSPLLCQMIGGFWYGIVLGILATDMTIGRDQVEMAV